MCFKINTKLFSAKCFSANIFVNVTFYAFYAPKCFYSPDAKMQEALYFSPSSVLHRFLWDRSPVRRLTENMRSLITGVTVPALCLRLCPTATIKAGSRLVSAPGMTFEGVSEGEQSKNERKKERMK